MGGIKNKLNKLSNKAKTLSSNLGSHNRGAVSRRLTEGLFHRWSLYASKTIGSLRLVSLTKYLAISCFTLALISTIGLNLYRTYSSSNTLSNAKQIDSGWLIGDSLNGAGYSGSYWSSNPLGTSAYYFSLSVRDGAEVGNSDRSFGRTVRCVVDN